jgi:hypothetical protein
MQIRLLIPIILILFLISCGSKESKSNDAVFMANVYLSDNKCDLALAELTKVDPEYYNFYYYQALASAKACKASYSVLNFINEIDDFTTTSSFFNFLAGLSTSNETTTASANFAHLTGAINSILFLKSVSEPRFSDRLNVITNRSQAEELSLQALLMIFVYLGKWLNLYGDTDDAGLKGTGVLCLLAYPTEASSFLNVAERTALLGASGTCLPASAASSPLLPFGVTDTRNALCNFIVYFNHVRDLTSNITLSSHTSMGDLSDAFADMENYVDAAEVAFPGIGNVLTFYNVDSCNTYYDSNNGAKKNIHAFMAGIVDENFQ